MGKEKELFFQALEKASCRRAGERKEFSKPWKCFALFFQALEKCGTDFVFLFSF
jgi:hypothetical protein